MRTLLLSGLVAGSLACTPVQPLKINGPRPEPTEQEAAGGTPPAASSLGKRELSEEDAVRDPRTAASQLQLTQEIYLLTNSARSGEGQPDKLHFMLASKHSQLAGRNDAAGDAREARRNRAEAVREYQYFVKTYPNDEHVPEALYFAGLDYERLGDRRSARAVWYDLIKKAPDSSWIPYAYYGFGVLFREEARTDGSKAEFARKAFVEAGRYTGPIAVLGRNQATGSSEPIPARNSEMVAQGSQSPTAVVAPSATKASAASSSRVPLPAVRAASPQSTAYALVIGVERYRDVPSPTGARTDAEHFAHMLKTSLGLRDDHMRVALDDHATKNDIEKHLQWLKATVPAGSRIYFYFAGHGSPKASGASYLVPHDGDPKDLDQSSLPLQEVMNRLSSTRANDVVAFVDACFSGAGGRSVLPPGTRPLMRVKETVATSKLVIFSASQGEEVSGPAREKDRGVFTKYVVQALGFGKADVDGDGRISLTELSQWVGPRVTSESKLDKRDQHPEVSLGAGVGAAKDFMLAWGVASD